ncbi:MAG: HD domain-containing protein [bacterium]
MIKFIDLFNVVDTHTQESIKELKNIPQSPKWHPEGDALTHTIIVYNRAKKYNDINLLLGAFFHDIGKLTTTFKNKKDHWAAHAHEKKSLKYVKNNQDVIEKLGGDYKKVYDIVHHHMRIKYYDDMKPIKQERMRNFHVFNELVQFSKIDDMSNVNLKEINIASQIMERIINE